MLSITILPLELFWCLDFFIHLLTPYNPFHVADYMFTDTYTLFVRLLSLFHIAVVIILIAYLKKWRYNPRALYASIIFFWATIIGTYLFTDPAKNINFVFSPIEYHWTWISSFGWLLFLMTVPLVVVVFPMHFLLKKLFSSK
jgi:hypothetical protein